MGEMKIVFKIDRSINGGRTIHFFLLYGKEEKVT